MGGLAEEGCCRRQRSRWGTGCALTFFDHWCRCVVAEFTDSVCSFCELCWSFHMKYPIVNMTPWNYSFFFFFLNAYFSYTKYSNITSTFVHDINLFKSVFLNLLRTKLLVHIWSFLGRYLFKIKPKQELCRHTSLSWSDWIVLPLCKYDCSVWEQPTKQATEAGLWWNHTLS